MGLLALLFVVPWESNLLGGRLADGVVTAVANTPSIERVKADYQLWRQIDTYVPIYLCVLSVIALARGVVKRHWQVLVLGLWTILLALLVAARLIRLPGAGHMQSFAILIALYIPVGIMVGWLVAWLLTTAIQRWKKMRVQGVAAAILLIAVLGFRQRAAVVNPAYALVNRSDEVAMEWIRANVPSDAVFLVNGFLIYGGAYAAGSDAGWWIPYLARRDNTMPPQYALLNERETIAGYGRAVVQLVSELDENSPVTPEGLAKLCQFGVTHIYVGQGQGKVALEPLNPYLVPADLRSSPYFDLVYHEDRVWIFAVKDAVCS
jgi:hypothetical protein